jgi:PIN domain nuclease of toxin-antitoxin system
LWALFDPERLRPTVRDVLSDLRNELWVSAASAWELAIKRALGRIDLPPEFDDAIRVLGIKPLAVTQEHAFAAGSLPLHHHKDPFDRMLVAQARIEGLTLVTRDARLTRYEIPVLLA